jgi:hypothetical protein
MVTTSSKSNDKNQRRNPAIEKDFRWSRNSEKIHDMPFPSTTGQPTLRTKQTRTYGGARDKIRRIGLSLRHIQERQEQ